MNRFTGLLLARERLEAPAFTAADADFVRRNLVKAELAQPGIPEWRDDILRLHAAGVEFKFHPQRSTASREVLREHWETLVPFAQLVWLWLEEQRLGARSAGARARTPRACARASALGAGHPPAIPAC